MNKKVKLQKWGNSQGIRLSKEVLRELDLVDMENVQFEIIVKDNELCLKPTNIKSDYEQLFEGYDLSQPMAMFEWGEPVGREVF